MPYLVATDRPLIWAAEYNGKIFVSDIAPIGGKIGIPPSLTAYSDTDENTFLGKVVSKAVDYKPLPPAGTQLQAGEIYGYNGGLVIVRQTHIRTEHRPEDVPALFSVYRADQTGPLAWVANERVEVGTLRTYGGKTWKCLQAHTTQVDWTPPQVPALWADATVQPPGVWAVGVAYKVGDIVTYTPNGLTYQCLQAHTSQATWTPPAVPALWKKL